MTTPSCSTSVSALSKRQRLESTSLGGHTNVSTGVSVSVPHEHLCELMLVTRDFLYGMRIAASVEKTCAFSLGGSDEDGAEGVTLHAREECSTANEKTLTRLAKHLLFASGNMTEDAFKHVVLFVVGSFGRYCRAESCSRSWGGCGLKSMDTDFDPTDRIKYVDAVLKLKTDISITATEVMRMRTEAITSGRLAAFENLTTKHATVLASLVYPQAYPQSLKAKCFESFRGYISARGRFYSITTPGIENVLRTFDGQTKTYFQRAPRDDTDNLMAALCSETYKAFFIRQISKNPKNADQFAWASLAPGFDFDGTSDMKQIAIQEMEATQEDTLCTTRLGRICLVPDTSDFIVGKAFSPRSSDAKHHIPPMTMSLFRELVFHPTPPRAGSSVSAAGGEHAGVKMIYTLKRHGRIDFGPQYDAPDRLLEARTMDEVNTPGSLSFNTFLGFHADHAYAAFHPSDLHSRGVLDPDMAIPPNLVRLGAWGRLLAGANMMNPVAAAYFAVGTPVEKSKFTAAAAADALEAHCVHLAVFLDAAAKWHTEKTVGDTNKFLGKTTYFHKVVDITRNAATFGELVTVIKGAFGNRHLVEAELRVAATLLKLAAGFCPVVYDEYPAMMQAYREWRVSRQAHRKPQAYMDDAADANDKERRAATLVLCGYVFFPDSDGVMGVSDVFQRSGEGLRYGDFRVEAIMEDLVHGALTLSSDLVKGIIGFKLFGHAERTLKTAHRIILCDAVRHIFGKHARLATLDEVPTQPIDKLDRYTVTKQSQTEVEVTDMETTRTVRFAVHPSVRTTENSGTVVPVVFSPAGELVFERHSPCTRGAVGAHDELHGAQLLRKGDVVSVWTTPVAEKPTETALMAAICWNDLDAARWPGMPRSNEQNNHHAVFNIVSPGTAERPTPVEVVDAVFAHGVVHREPTTVASYLFSPTKTGDDNVPGQGVGKTAWLRCSMACVGPNLVDMVNDYDRLVKTDQFTDKGHSTFFTLVDDIDDPKIILSGSAKAAATAKENEARVKHAGNKKMDNYNTTFYTGNCHISLDEVEKSVIQGERRVCPVRAWSTMVGDVTYFQYIYATYFSVNPLIQKCILESWRSLSGVGTRSTGDLQKMAKCVKSYWAGQVPMRVGFLQKLYCTARMDRARLREAHERAALDSGRFTLLSGMDASWTHVSEKTMCEAAAYYTAQLGHEYSSARAGGRTSAANRNAENARLILKQLKDEAESSKEGAWAAFYRSAVADDAVDTKEPKQQMCFSVKQDVIRDVVALCGYQVYDIALPNEAPNWAPRP